MSTIEGNLILEEKDSREAERVYMTAAYAYKIFANLNQAGTAFGIYNQGVQKDVPVTKTKQLPQVQYKDGNQPIQNLIALRSERAKGKFFQFSKGGAEKIILNKIQEVNDATTLRGIWSAFTAAKSAALTDPQGFIDIDNHNQPILFIDVHLRPTINDAFDDIIEAARTRHNGLNPSPTPI